MSLTIESSPFIGYAESIVDSLESCAEDLSRDDKITEVAVNQLRKAVMSLKKSGSNESTSEAYADIVALFIDEEESEIMAWHKWNDIRPIYKKEMLLCNNHSFHKLNQEDVLSIHKKEFHLCKGKSSRKLKHRHVHSLHEKNPHPNHSSRKLKRTAIAIKRYIQKHKKAIIIGAVVAVAVTATIIVIACSVGTAAPAAAAGLAAVGGALADSNEPTKPPTYRPSSTSTPPKNPDTQAKLEPPTQNSTSENTSPLKLENSHITTPSTQPEIPFPLVKATPAQPAPILLNPVQSVMAQTKPMADEPSKPPFQKPLQDDASKLLPTLAQTSQPEKPNSPIKAIPPEPLSAFLNPVQSVMAQTKFAADESSKSPLPRLNTPASNATTDVKTATSFTQKYPFPETYETTLPYQQIEKALDFPQAVTSMAAHMLFDSISNLASLPSAINEKCNGVFDVLASSGGLFTTLPEMLNTSWDDIRAKGHENIDAFFETNQAANYPELSLTHRLIQGAVDVITVIPGATNAIIAPAAKYAIKIAESAAIGEKLAFVSEALAPITNAFKPAFALEIAENATLKTASTDLRVLKTIESLESGLVATESSLAKESALEKALTQSNKGISAEEKIINQTSKTLATEEPLLAKVKPDPIAELTTPKNRNPLENSGLEKLVSQSDSEVLKSAIDKNKHVKMVKDYLDKPVKEIQKGINSYEKQIAIHKDKIVNPTKYYPDWDKLDPRQCDALINKKWPAEIQGYEEQKNILQSILNERIN